MKPYHSIPIQDCGEPLVAIPSTALSFVVPHPYEALGAPYGDKSPFFLRRGVLERLQKAQAHLQQLHPQWQIQVFDAYRPVAVQQFMVDYSFAALLTSRSLEPQTLTAEQKADLLQEVYQFWAPPSHDPATPPPHSTGAAIDVTLVDDGGQAVNMGSPIDEISPRSYPDYFADCQDGDAQTYHQNRQLLLRVMGEAGFQRHPNEWWHFSWGDQLWAWQLQEQLGQPMIAQYGGMANFDEGILQS